MNIENLKKVIEVLNNTDPQKFDMRTTHDVDTDKRCVVGIIQKEIGVNANIFLSTGISSKWLYIVHAGWADDPMTNTIENAVYRIEKIILGYEPGNIHIEIQKELDLIYNR